ncbi:MAG: hypothetical protein NVSMB65_21410 [Chloroflexota bacterium]
MHEVACTTTLYVFSGGSRDPPRRGRRSAAFSTWSLRKKTEASSMKGLNVLRVPLLAALIGAVSLGGSAHPTAAASHLTVALSDYGAAAIVSLAGSKVTGAEAIIREPGHLSVYVSVSGLTPGSTHAVSTHGGACGGNGPVKFSLTHLVADAAGNASSYTVVTAPKIRAEFMNPSAFWYITILSDTAARTPIACGNWWTPIMLVPLHTVGASQAAGVAMFLRNMDTRSGMSKRAQGAAVVVLVKHLPANTTHAEHVHKGKCGSNGPIVIPLTPLLADATGAAVAGAFIIKGMHVIGPGLYVNVHAADGSVMACGDVMGRIPPM